MYPNSSNTSLAFGLAVFSMAAVGVWLYRRSQVRGTCRVPERDVKAEGGLDGEGQSLDDDLAGHQGVRRYVRPNSAQGNLPLKYFSLVFALALPFWWFGGRKLPLPINLPLSALATFVPLTAAAILTYRRNGFDGVKGLLMRAMDYKNIKHKTWYLPALFLAPLIYFGSYVFMRLIGLPLPDPVNIPLLLAPFFFVIFLIGDAGEELGWTAYAIEPMQDRWGAFKASLGLGVIWALWHAIPFVQTGNPPKWVIWQSIKTVATRIMIVWIYNNTGKSVLAAILYHASDNLSWSLFPNKGSHYNPFVTALTTWLTAAILSIGWKPKTSARFRYASASTVWNLATHTAF